MNVMNTVDTAVPYDTFEVVNTQPIPLLNLTVEEYKHKITGARHIHLASDDPHNVFLVAFLTVPQDSKGVAHILEHTALCGSKRFPVRDPFFMMIRRSLNTFMNAFTAGDWTAYPFATLNKKDFSNLLDVYLDAAFFPNLNALDFAQEGHRLEFKEADNPESPLEFKGVVFNEMKGAMSSPNGRLAQAFQSHLFPTITYHHNSGGEPADIIDLTHDELKAFHAKHYHPSNALFFTYGDIPARQHQEAFEDKVLNEFDALDIDFSVPDEQRYDSPKTVEASYPLAPGEKQDNNTYNLLGWLLEPVTDTESLFENQLLEAILLDNSASPLMAALEQSHLGTAPAPYCGYDANTRETVFAAGLQGSDPDKAAEVEKLVLDTLKEVAENGIGQDTIDAMLHQFELSQREVSGGSFPYGLQLIMDTIGVSIHGGNPADALDLDPQLDILREKTKDKNYVPNLIKRKLLDNPHRISLCMKPDDTLAEQEAKAEQQRLAQITEQLDDAKKAKIVEQAAALANHQNQEDDPSLLPKVGIEDVAKEMNIAQSTDIQLGKHKVTAFEQGTNGLLYEKLVMPIPELSEEELDWLPFYCNLFGELGTADMSYMDVQKTLSSVVGSLGMTPMIKPNAERDNQIEGFILVSIKALASKHQDAAKWMIDLLKNTQFTEHKRIKELLQQVRAGKLSSVVSAGHGYVMGAASAAVSGFAARQLKWEGLQAAARLKGFADEWDAPEFIENIAQTLTSIHSKVLNQPIQLMTVGEAASLEQISEQSELWSGFDVLEKLENPVDVELPVIPTKTAWEASSQVNYVGMAYPAVPANHDDAPALHVLSEYLRNVRLHTLIREKGGAYGGGASFSPDLRAFRFFSYRDPRTTGTIDDFIQTAEWMANHQHDEDQLEEAILGVIGAIDKPSSPAGEATSTFIAELFGATAEKRQSVRQKILKVTLDDLKRVSEQYLKPENAHIAVLGGKESLSALGDEFTTYHI